MKTSAQFAVVAVLTFVTVVVAMGATAGEDQRSNTQLNQIVRTLKDRGKGVKSLFVEVAGDVIVPRGCYSDAYPAETAGKGILPSQDYTYKESITLLLDFENNRVRKHSKDRMFVVKNADFAPLDTLQICDGKQIKVFQPRERNTSAEYTPAEYQPDLYVQRDAYKGLLFSPADYPVFFALGYLVTPGQSPNAKRLRVPLHEDELRYEGDGTVADRQCSIVRSKTSLLSGEMGFDEYWIDTGHDGAVVRWVRYMGGDVATKIDADYRHVDGGWQPAGWTATIFLSDNRKIILATHRLQVTAYRANPELSDDQFDIALAPNTIVRDVEKDKLYKVNGDLSQTEITGMGPRRSQAGQVSPGQVLAIILYVVGTLALAVFVIIRRIRRRQHP